MTLPLSFVVDVLPTSFYRSELLRFCSLSGKLFQCFFILTDRRFFPMVQRKSLVLQVKLITSCLSYHGNGQRFFPTPMSVYFCIDFTVFAFIDVSSLNRVEIKTDPRLARMSNVWVHDCWVKPSSLSGHSITSFYLFQLLPQKGACRNVYRCFNIPP